MHRLRKVLPPIGVRLSRTFLIACALASTLSAAPAVLTRAAQIRALSAEEAAKGLPVRLHTVVTHYDPGWNDLFVQDATGGAYVAAEHPLNIRQGQLVEVTGISGPGEFAPIVKKPEIRVLGPGKLPQPRRVSYEELISGTLDASWVEVEGTVRSAVADRHRLNLSVGLGADRVRATVVNFPRDGYAQLVNARVRLRGACGATFTKRRQLTGVILHVQSLNDVVVIGPVGIQTSDLPLRHASSLLQFSPRESVAQPARLQGVVTFQRARELYLRDGGQGLIVLAQQANALHPGDRVEVIGFPAPGEYNPVLQDATVRQLGRGPAPHPILVTAGQASEHDGDLVEIEADVVSRTVTPKGQWLGLKSGTNVFRAEIDRSAAAGLPPLQEGSRVRVSGICLIETGGDFNEPVSFRLLVRSQRDLVVLGRPAWWTLERTLRVMIFLSLAIFGALVWVLLLRRRVTTQTNQLLKNNQEMESALRAAKEATELKSQLLANMSHEIRTPRNGILGMAGLALAGDLYGEQRGYISDAMKSAESLLGLLNDILDFSKIEAGRLELDPIDFSIGECVADAVAALAVPASQKGLKLEVEIGADVPDAALGDPVRIRQVLLNLVNNAIKFTTAGTIAVTVDVFEARDRTAQVHFCVSDTGSGIPADKIGPIFEPFRQADGSTTRKHGGTGLGLTISSRLVELMGGNIWAESELGKGSKFHFVIPLEPATHAVAPKPARDVTLEQLETRPLEILVAEDNLINQKITVRLLEKAGHRVTVASDGREALAAWREKPFDVVLMDIQMPHLNGFECTEAIRALEEPTGGRVPILALTAHALKGYDRRCLDVGMDVYISKPMRPEELMAAIHRVTAGGVSQPLLPIIS